MGQYHKIVNLDKREVLSPHTLGAGWKLLEQVDGFVPRAIFAALVCSNDRGGGNR